MLNLKSARVVRSRRISPSQAKASLLLRGTLKPAPSLHIALHRLQLQTLLSDARPRRPHSGHATECGYRATDHLQRNAGSTEPHQDRRNHHLASCERYFTSWQMHHRSRCPAGYSPKRREEQAITSQQPQQISIHAHFGAPHALLLAAACQRVGRKGAARRPARHDAASRPM